MAPHILVDIGANLAHDSFDADREQVIERGRAAGVAAMIVTGSTLDDSEKAIALCRRHAGHLRATAGVHPHHATTLKDGDAGRLAELLADPMVVAAGECGLDYFRNFSPPEEQRRAFELQLALGEQLGRHLFLHQRDAHTDFVAMLRAHPEAASRGVLHCFTGGPAELEDCLALGLSIGVTGWICDERRGQGLREAASAHSRRAADAGNGRALSAAPHDPAEARAPSKRARDTSGHSRGDGALSRRGTAHARRIDHGKRMPLLRTYTGRAAGRDPDAGRTQIN